ncbi:MAG: DUF6511 domain-containing protein [Bradyrhizobium sp.]|uniref:DUF6511 domain-containing protein n=1 Tax=Bradyrhizobium sp. TaxID=376 RepID=UPI0029A01A82|nr:DUF6511 domain-containing protein [Bradyrhizobium sp.]MDX3966126.1 DUF6511 domain-containing protein [Bradyrhizobium sp.]
MPPGTKGKQPILWLCEAPECISLGKAVFHMVPKTLTATEALALQDAGAEAGAYLERLGKFSLADLTEKEWGNFLTTILNSYGENMRKRVTAAVAPF